MNISNANNGTKSYLVCYYSVKLKVHAIKFRNLATMPITRRFRSISIAVLLLAFLAALTYLQYTPLPSMAAKKSISSGCCTPLSAEEETQPRSNATEEEHEDERNVVEQNGLETMMAYTVLLTLHHQQFLFHHYQEEVITPPPQQVA